MRGTTRVQEETLEANPLAYDSLGRRTVVAWNGMRAKGSERSSD